MSTDPLKLKLQSTQFLKATGILDAYEHTIETLVTNGWPSDKSVFEHAAYELLRWHADHKDEYADITVKNPGNPDWNVPMQAAE